MRVKTKAKPPPFINEEAWAKTPEEQLAAITRVLQDALDSDRNEIEAAQEPREEVTRKARQTGCITPTLVNAFIASAAISNDRNRRAWS